MEHDDSFQEYLKTLDCVPTVTIIAARQIWQLIEKEFNNIFPLPVAIPIENQGLQLSWTLNRQHLSIDVCTDILEWFFRDRKTGDLDGGDIVGLESLPKTLLYRLSLINGENYENQTK